MNDKIQELLDDLERSPAATIAWTETRERIVKLFRASESFEERGLLLKIYVLLMNSVETMKLVTDVADFREMRRKDYNLLLISESTDGKDVVPSKLLAALNREIEAGHIDKTHELYDLASEGAMTAKPPPVKSSWWSRLRGR